MNSLVEVIGVVESITPSGFADHTDDGGFAIFDTMLLDVTPIDGDVHSKLHVVLDGRAAQGERWHTGQRVRFEIEERYLSAAGPVFRGTLRNVRTLSDEDTP